MGQTETMSIVFYRKASANASQKQLVVRLKEEKLSLTMQCKTFKLRTL